MWSSRVRTAVLLIASTTSAVGLYGYFYAQSLLELYPIRNPPGAYDSINAKLPRGTLDKYLKHFYSTWTLRLEGLGARLAGLKHEEGKDFAHGLFKVIARDSESVMVDWGSPLPKPQDGQAPGARSIDQKPSFSDGQPLGGTQEFRCTPLNTSGSEPGEGPVEISYTCRERYKRGPEAVSPVIIKFHRLYMRFLFDQARRKMLKDPI